MFSLLDGEAVAQNSGTESSTGRFGDKSNRNVGAGFCGGAAMNRSRGLAGARSRAARRGSNPRSLFFLAAQKVSAEGTMLRVGLQWQANWCVGIVTGAEGELVAWPAGGRRLVLGKRESGDVIGDTRLRPNVAFAADEHSAVAHDRENFHLVESGVLQQGLEGGGAGQKPVEDLLLRIRRILGVENRMESLPYRAQGLHE